MGKKDKDKHRMSALDSIIARANEQRASDVHIAAGVPVRFRIDGKLIDADDRVLEPQDCEQLGRMAAGTTSTRSRVSASWTWPTPTPMACAAV